MVVHHVTAPWQEHLHLCWTSAIKLVASAPVSFMWKAMTVIDANQDFIICHKATHRAVCSVHVTPKEQSEDQDSANSSLETVLVSHW